LTGKTRVARTITPQKALPLGSTPSENSSGCGTHKRMRPAVRSSCGCVAGGPDDCSAVDFATGIDSFGEFVRVRHAQEDSARRFVPRAAASRRRRSEHGQRDINARPAKTAGPPARRVRWQAIAAIDPAARRQDHGIDGMDICRVNAIPLILLSRKGLNSLSFEGAIVIPSARAPRRLRADRASSIGRPA